MSYKKLVYILTVAAATERPITCVNRSPITIGLGFSKISRDKEIDDKIT